MANWTAVKGKTNLLPTVVKCPTEYLPQNLIFKCPNQKIWTYMDKVCDTRNDCGNCSDESAENEFVPVCPSSLPGSKILSSR
ncbi:low-density lipoprotein receptor class A domain-containing protein 1-like [Trachypithecus francoisi]|uniref:low-density lipoprotein receptor class A domain-containing protein 1-like n=1 Tax=Trachypithecus francoisi TaxID=54180 RepID=UPI00141AFC44|nr:low-density lipoprotein receptor class A domain-containing protein 1-like [Trachypithecus francoisi]